jgi:type I restriction enzyme S subunit
MTVARLEDVSEFVLDGTHASPVRTETGVPVLSAQNVKDGVLDFKTDRYTSEEEYRSFNSRLALQEGDLLLTIVGTIGRSAVVSAVRPLVFQRSVAIIRPKATVVDPRFFYHASRSQKFQAQLASSANQSSQAGVYLGKLKRVEIPLPPLTEQRRIAELLDRAEALRTKRLATLAQLDILTQSIFLDLFGDPATNPKGWPCRPVGEIAAKFSDGPFGSNLKTSHYTDSGVRVVRLQNIGVGEFVDEDKAYVSKRHFAELEKHECRPGDVLVGTLGDPNLRACTQPEWLEVALNKADCVQLRPDKRLATSDYVCALLNHPSTERMAQELIVGQTRLRISMGRLRGLRVPVPPLALQHDFRLRVAAVEKLKTTQRTALASLDALFAGLQHRAFRGEL